MDYNSSIIEVFRKITRKQAFIIAILASIFLFGYFIAPTVFDYINKSDERKEKRIEREIDVEKEVNRRLDSINDEKKRVEAELFIFKNNQIVDLMAYLERRITTSTHITIFSIHNGGGTPRTGGEAKVSVLYTTDNIRGVDLKKDWENRELYDGVADYAYEMLRRKGKPFYVNAVKKYPSIYEGKTKIYMNSIGTKSMYGMWIKTGTTATYYISMSFDEEYGVDIEGVERVSNLMENARTRLISLLDVK